MYLRHVRARNASGRTPVNTCANKVAEKVLLRLPKQSFLISRRAKTQLSRRDLMLNKVLIKMLNIHCVRNNNHSLIYSMLTIDKNIWYIVGQ